MRPLKLFVLALLCVFQTVGVLSGSPIVMCVMVGIIGLVTGHRAHLLSEITRGQQGNSALAASATLVSMCFMRISRARRHGRNCGRDQHLGCQDADPRRQRRARGHSRDRRATA